MMINPRLLRHIDEISKAGSMRRAATRLNISSSALNRQILALEDQLGTPIFERLPKRLRLTASGELLVAHAQEMAKADARLLGRLAAVKGQRRGTIRIATMGGLAHSPLLKLVDAFAAGRRDVLMRIEIANREGGIAGRVLAGDADLGLGYNIQKNPALRVLAALDVQVGAVVSPRQELAASPSTKLSICAAYPIATAPTAAVIRDLTDLAFADANVPMQPSLETDSIDIMKQAAISGSYITFLNPLDISAELERGDLVYVPLADRHFAIPTLHLIARARGSLEVAAGKLAEELRALMAELAKLPHAGLVK